MDAVQFNFTYARYGLGLALGKLYPPLLWSGLSCTSLREVPPPPLPGPQWARVDTILGGICGTDLGTIGLHTSPYYSPFSDFPFTFGHEVVGTLNELGAAVSGFQAGQRVVVEPTLWCAPRGFAEADWCDYCRRGETNRCLNKTRGDLAPGLFIGSCKDTGGAWSASFVAHQSQLYAVPASVSNENALMVEPLACGLHAALADFPADHETILILGAGTIGLVTLAALRALGSRARILVSARYDFQAEAARKLGASEVLQGGDLYAQVAERTGATLLQPKLGKRVVSGGADRVYECVGSDSALDDAIRLARAGRKVGLVGVPGIARGVDWSAIFAQELTLIGSTEYGHAERYDGKVWSAFELALHLMETGKVDLGWMVTRRYALADYKQALGDLHNKKRQPIIKAVFEFQGGNSVKVNQPYKTVSLLMGD
jgi:threonine dehydrogenase-like Zn-dependent dehydrogenase